MTNNRISALALNTDGFVFDPQTGESFIVNETGRVIIEALAESAGQEVAASRLLDRFHVRAPEAEADVRDFVQHLRAHGLV